LRLAIISSISSFFSFTLASSKTGAVITCANISSVSSKPFFSEVISTSASSLSIVLSMDEPRNSSFLSISSDEYFTVPPSRSRAAVSSPSPIFPCGSLNFPVRIIALTCITGSVLSCIRYTLIPFFRVIRSPVGGLKSTVFIAGIFGSAERTSAALAVVISNAPDNINIALFIWFLLLFRRRRL